MSNILAPLRKLNNYALEQVIFFITAKCNLRCEHCFYWDNLNVMKDMTFEEVEKLSRQAPRFHTLLTSGGEPYLRKELFEIFHMFYVNNGVRWFSIPTNGFWPDKIAARTREFLLGHPDAHLRINVSIDGFEATHDKIRDLKSSYKNAIATLDTLRELRAGHPNFSLAVTTVVSPSNLAEIREFSDHIYQDHRPDSHNIVAIREGYNKDADLALRRETLAEMWKFNVEIHGRYLPIEGQASRATIRGSFNEALNKVMLRTHYDRMISGTDWPMPCVAGRVIVVIDANGDLRSCEMRPPVLNLREFDLNLTSALASEAMQNEVAQVAKDRCFCAHGCFSLPSIQRSPKAMLVDVPLEMARTAIGR